MTPRLPVPIFHCEKQPASGARGMVVANHPLAASAGAEMLLAGGNAIDAATAALFALTVVEPMMVGILGGGIAHLRLADGTHRIIDGLSTAPLRAQPDMYETISDRLPNYRETRGRKNVVGPLAIAVPGALKAWCETLSQFGTMPLTDILAPAIRLAVNGFIVTPYLSDCIADCAADLLTDKQLAQLFLPAGQPLRAGARLVRGDYADTLKLIAQQGAAALYDGPLGQQLNVYMNGHGGLIGQEDLSAYATVERAPVQGRYRTHAIIGPPPPASSGVHIAQMLNILEGYDIAGMGFASADTIHVMAEAMKIAFADRAMATADPAFVDVPIAALIDKVYAKSRRDAIDMGRAQHWNAGLARHESANTTHVTVADAQGNVISTTQTINGLFGACVAIPGTGMIANNYMFNFDPHPGLALSIEPGKRVYTSMAPMMALKDGQLQFALGLPGGLRIFPSALQAIINIIDHGMSLQEAVEAPRIWTEGGVLEMEHAIPKEIAEALRARGHDVQYVQRIAGGMNAISFGTNGVMTGAACWRADGTPVAISGGLARAGVRFTAL